MSEYTGDPRDAQGYSHPWNDRSAYPPEYQGPRSPPVPGIHPWDHQDLYDYQNHLWLEDVRRMDLLAGGYPRTNVRYDSEDDWPDGESIRSRVLTDPGKKAAELRKIRASADPFPLASLEDLVQLLPTSERQEYSRVQHHRGSQASTYLAGCIRRQVDARFVGWLSTNFGTFVRHVEASVAENPATLEDRLEQCEAWIGSAEWERVRQKKPSAVPNFAATFASYDIYEASRIMAAYRRIFGRSYTDRSAPERSHMSVQDMELEDRASKVIRRVPFGRPAGYPVD